MPQNAANRPCLGTLALLCGHFRMQAGDALSRTKVAQAFALRIQPLITLKMASKELPAGVEDVVAAPRSKPEGLELICTGRGAPRQLMDVVDLVTEMVNHKHYDAVAARDGIER